MARLASKEKMGFYPTPADTLETISRKVLGRDFSKVRYDGSKLHLLDPCCGEGEALSSLRGWLFSAVGWGVELDSKRALKVDQSLNVVQSSIFDVEIEPEACTGLLWLNPPYDDSGDREREEMKFLKSSVKWLCPNGVLVFIVPERIFEQEKNRRWISGWFHDCSIYRIVKEEFGQFKQAVLFGRKRKIRHNNPLDLPCPPYSYLPRHYENGVEIPFYEIPVTEGPKVFKGKLCMSNEEIIVAGSETRNMIKKMILDRKDIKGYLSPLFPLRKGHLVALITAGFLNGKVSTGPGENDFILIKGYSERKESTHIEEDKEITTNTYSVGIRILDPTINDFYDIK